MTKISENIERNRNFWKQYSQGYVGSSITRNYSGTYGGYLHLVNEQLIRPYIHSESTVLEIGPGNGRWTQFFSKAKEIICVDIMDLEKILRKRYPCMNLKVFKLEDNIKLGFLADCSIDYIFSFDTFVHLEVECIQAYLKEFYRVLKFGSHGVIHYSDWEKYKLHTGTYPQIEQEWPKNNLNMMMNHIKTANLTIIREDTNLLLRDRIAIFAKGVEG